jgi:spore coat polysaccharide biosynthesis protein SpsF
MLPLAERPMLEHVVERARRSRRSAEVIVATTDEAVDDAVEKLCERIGAPCHRGSEHDVLSRFVAVARQRDRAPIVRLTADNPFCDGVLVDMVAAARTAAASQCSYACNFQETPGLTGFPYGLYAEAVSADMLEEAHRFGDDEDREHVTRYFRRRPERFPRVVVSAPRALPMASLTVDTSEDYARLKRLFEEMYEHDPGFSFVDPDRAYAGSHVSRGTGRWT